MQEVQKGRGGGGETEALTEDQGLVGVGGGGVMRAVEELSNKHACIGECVTSVHHRIISGTQREPILCSFSVIFQCSLWSPKGTFPFG